MASYVDYQATRRFVSNSRLRSYLAHKRPASLFLSRDTATLHEVLQYLREVIEEERLYDPHNASLVLCDAGLEVALDVKALHLTEIRCVCACFMPRCMFL